jgi:hypothetical protein
MIELTKEQVQALAAQKAPLQLVNPATQEVFVLIRKEVYDLTCNIVGGGPGRVWHDLADDDLIPKGALSAVNAQPSRRGNRLALGERISGADREC